MILLSYFSRLVSISLHICLFGAVCYVFAVLINTEACVSTNMVLNLFQRRKTSVLPIEVLKVLTSFSV